MDKILIKNKVINFVKNFKSTVQSEKWTSLYDVEADSLTLGKIPFSEDTQLLPISKDVVFYVNKENDVHGIFIEYYLTNMLSHNTKLKPLKKKLEKLLVEKDDEIVELKDYDSKVSINIFQELLQESVKNNRLLI